MIGMRPDQQKLEAPESNHHGGLSSRNYPFVKWISLCIITIQVAEKFLVNE